MEIESYIYMYNKDCDFLEIERIIVENYFNLSEIGIENYGLLPVSNGLGYSTDQRLFDFLEDGLEDLISKTFPFLSRHYDLVDFGYDLSSKKLILGKLNETLIDPSDSIIVNREPLIFGDFSDTFKESDVIFKKSGVCHEIIFAKDNKLITRGSNANGQLGFNYEIKSEPSFECGDFFTAFLEKGKVEVYGYLGNVDHQVPFNKTIKIDKDLALRPEDVGAKIKIGKELSVNLENSKYNVLLDDERLGYISSNARHKNEYFNYLFSFLTPVISEISDDVDKIVERQKKSIDFELISVTKDVLQEYSVSYLGVDEWIDIVSIHPIENGLLGRDKNNNLYFDGEVNNILKLVDLLEMEMK